MFSAPCECEWGVGVTWVSEPVDVLLVSLCGGADGFKDAGGD